MKFRDKVAIVTGSSAGIGRHVALEFARHGANVVVNGRNADSVESVVGEIVSAGGSALGCVADVTVKHEVADLVTQTIARFGRIDILVNNAGGSSGSTKLEEITEDEWDGVVGANLKSVFLCVQAVIGTMKTQRYGKVITIASQAGRALSALAGPNYASAKAGAIAFTRHVAKESAPFGINVNAIAPGVVYSGPRIEQIWNSFSEDQQLKIIQAIPAGRLASNDDIAAAVLFLAGDESNYIIGATLDINGGRWML